MNDRKKQILQTKKGEVVKAGRLFFEAVFGDPHAAAREVAADIDRAHGHRVIEGQLEEDE